MLFFVLILPLVLRKERSSKTWNSRLGSQSREGLTQLSKPKEASAYLYCSAPLTGAATQPQTKDRGLGCILSLTVRQSSANIPCIYLITAAQQSWSETALPGDAGPHPQGEEIHPQQLFKHI